jgi:NADPH-dependent ferric siderophore reductase
MATDRLLDMVGRPGGPLADAALWHLEVIEAGTLSPSFRRVVVTAPGIEGLQCAPGQDLMLRIPLGDDKVVNRRYTIRSFDPVEQKVVVDVSLHGRGPGTDWISAARTGDRINAIGPRGKITPRADADWHLFVVDETGVPGTLAMIEALPAGSVAIALLQVDSPADEQEPEAFAVVDSTCIGCIDPADRYRAISNQCSRRSRTSTYPPDPVTSTSPPRLVSSAASPGP